MSEAVERLSLLNVEDALLEAYNTGYGDGFVDRDFDGAGDEEAIKRQIDTTSRTDGWANCRETILASLSPAVPVQEHPPEQGLVDRLVSALSDLVSEENCWLDHDGGCQAHATFGDGECPHAIAQRLLQEVWAKPATPEPSSTGRREAQENQAAPRHQPSGGVEREEVARIIDPEAWKLDGDGYLVAQIGSEAALSKADAVLSLLAAKQGETGHE